MTDQTIVLPANSGANGHDASYRLTMMVPRRRFLSYLRDRWWVVLVSLVLTVGAVLIYETVRTETYSSSAQLLAGDVQVNMANLFTEDPLNYFGTQIELLKSTRLQIAAYEKAGVKITADERDLIKLEVARPLGASILQLQATGRDPAAAQGFLRALINEYQSFKKETRTSTTEDLVASLTDQLAKREAALKAEQEKWLDFQKTNNIAVMVEEGKTAGLYLAELNLQLAKFKLERELLRQGLSAVPLGSATNIIPASKAASTNAAAPNLAADTALPANAIPILQPASDAMLKSARLELALRRSERDQTVKDRGETAARRLNEEVARLEKTVALLEDQNLSQRKSDLQDLEKRIAATEETIPAWETRVLEINDRLAQSQRLQINVQREQGYYDHLLGMFQNVDLSRNVQQDRVSILQPPTAAQPVKRYLPLRIVLGVMAGLIFSVGIVFAWHLLDDRFSSIRDVKDQFGEEVLGLVPRIRLPRSKPQQALLRDADSRHDYLESFRHLRSALLLSSGSENSERRPRTLLFTGVSSGEGKTTIAGNLARTLARSGMRVALMDADVQAGGMDRLLGAVEQRGLLDYLRGEAGASAIIQASDVPGLVYVSAGTHDQPGEGLFLRPKLGELMNELRADRDFVILDGSPILATDDAALLVPHADIVVMVVRPLFTHARQLHQALGMLYQRQAKQVAFVFNQARPDDFGGGYARNGRSDLRKNGRRPVNNGRPNGTRGDPPQSPAQGQKSA